MRILMISPQFWPVMGGYERAAERLARFLGARGHEVTMLSERRDRTWPRCEEVSGFTLRRWWCLYRPGLHSLSSALGLTLLLLRHGRRHEIWHVHQYGSAAAVAMVLGRLMRRPVLLKMTSSGDTGIASALAGHAHSRIISAVHRRADAVVALTREMAHEAEAFGIPRARLKLIGNGVDAAVFRPRGGSAKTALKERLGAEGRLWLLFVGRLSPEKNLPGLLRSWALAQPSLRGEWRLVLVGEGPLAAELRRQCEVNQLAVHFAGHREDVADWLAASDGFVLCSFQEGLSNTLLEAMSSGLPVICTEVSGAAQYVAEPGCGLVVPVGDDAALAQAIIALAGNEELRRTLGERGRQLVDRQLTLEAVGKRYETLYLSMLGRLSVESGETEC